MVIAAKKKLRQLGLLFFAVGVFAAAGYYSAPLSSIELGLSMHSTAGESGGAVLPASCPSYAHTAGECNAVSASISCTPSSVTRGSTTNCSWSCNTPPSTASWSAGSAPGVPGSSTYFNVNNALSGNQNLDPSLVLQAGGAQTGTVTYAIGCGYAWDGSSGSATTNVTVTAPPGTCTSNCTPTISCSPSTVNPGQSSSCDWQCGTGDVSSSGSNFATGGAVSGTATVNPSVTTVYGVQCNNSGDSNSDTVTVVSPTLSLAADPVRVRSGSSSTITWSATNVQSCTVSGPNFSHSGTSGSQSTGAITAQGVYTLTCRLLGTTAAYQSTSVTITLIPTQTEI